MFYAHPCYNPRMADTDTDTDTDEGAQSASDDVVTGEHSGMQAVSTRYRVSDTDTRYRVPAANGSSGYVVPIRTTERAREVAGIRWARYRAAAAARVVTAVQSVADADDSAVIAGALAASKRKGEHAAYGAIVGKLAERAYMDADPQAARFVRSAIGADVGAPERGAADTGTGVGVDTQSARDLADMLAAYREWRDGRAAGAGADDNDSVI